MNYPSTEQIKERCQLIADRYQIDERLFFQIIEHWDQKDVCIESKLNESFKGLLHQVSLEIGKINNEINLEPTCRMGCAFCCYYPIIITELEAKLIKNFIKNMPREQSDKIKNKLTNYQQHYSAMFTEASQIDFQTDSEFKQKYRAVHLPCPLLDLETNSCMAYDVRPIPCRTYLNYADPKICEQSAMPKETVSFEFLYQPYFEALNCFIQWLYEDGDTGFIRYPDDIYREDYLVNWLT